MNASCPICNHPLPSGARVCAACGTSQPDVPHAQVVPPPVSDRTPTLVLAALGPDQRYCPACEKVYEADYPDDFCTCGVELQTVQPAELPMAAVLPDVPPPGTTCLVLYGPERQPVHYFALTKDATLIGRLDAVAGHFPDLDLDAWLDPASARRISRQHALVLRQRAAGTFHLRPLAGNTGTQVEAEMVPPLHDYPLTPGCRLILGGVCRLKFEVVG